MTTGFTFRVMCLTEPQRRHVAVLSVVLWRVVDLQALQ